MKYFFRLIQIFAFILFSTAVYSDDSDQLKKLQELLDSGVLTEEQFNDAKSKLDSKGKSDGQKQSGVYEFFGVTLGGIVDVENQTIAGKPFKFQTIAIGRRDYYMDTWSDRAWKQNKAKSKFIWEGREGKDKEGRFLVLHENPDKKEKLKKVYFVEFAYFENIARVLRLDITPWEDSGNKVRCKKWATNDYMKFYNSGEYDISEEDHRFNLTDKEKDFVHGPNEDIWIYFGCYGGNSGAEWYWMGAEDNKLIEIHEANIAK